jgi:flagellar hook protein FlgE
MSAFAIPLSGLAASSASLNVIANNLANLNTDGYKDESLNFADVFNEVSGVAGNGDPIQVGSGVETSGQSSNFSNGTVTTTGVDSNMALQGNGFFVVQNSAGQTSYTRAGDFTVNSQGQLCTPQGQLVMGYPATAGVVSTSTGLTPISVNQASNIPAEPTSTFSMNTNLDAASAVGATYSAPITVYDSLGTTHVLTVQYTNQGSNSWSYSISVPSADTGGTGTPTPVATGTLQFDSSGQLVSPTGPVTGITISGLADGASNMNLTWNLKDSSANPTITQQSGTSATASTTQDGYGVGVLTGYSVLPDGTVEGQFSNSQTLALGQVAVANFSNAQGLTQTGGNNYQATFSSGTAVVGVAGSGGNGTITGDAVEQSNVNLSAEFANMIVAQQSYEANAKVLTTLNQVSQATLQMMT